MFNADRYRCQGATGLDTHCIPRAVLCYDIFLQVEETIHAPSQVGFVRDPVCGRPVPRYRAVCTEACIRVVLPLERRQARELSLGIPRFWTFVATRVVGIRGKALEARHLSELISAMSRERIHDVIEVGLGVEAFDVPASHDQLRAISVPMYQIYMKVFTSRYGKAVASSGTIEGPSFGYRCISSLP